MQYISHNTLGFSTSCLPTIRTLFRRRAKWVFMAISPGPRPVTQFANTPCGFTWAPTSAARLHAGSIGVRESQETKHAVHFCSFAAVLGSNRLHLNDAGAIRGHVYRDRQPDQGTDVPHGDSAYERQGLNC